MDNFISGNPVNLNSGNNGTSNSSVAKSQPATASTLNIAAQSYVPQERIQSVKTFYTKLHAGAMAFLDEQITCWLKENPNVYIKRINVIEGEIQGKNKEPNIIITVWY